MSFDLLRNLLPYYHDADIIALVLLATLFVGPSNKVNISLRKSACGKLNFAKFKQVEFLAQSVPLKHLPEHN